MINYENEHDALKDFAIILSKAVAEDEQVRSFIREEALKQYDCDFDVFYPYVKDNVIESNKSFSQILYSYQEHDNQLDAIEKAVPKLTIMVPDFSWIESNCFSIHGWKTSDEMIAVGYDDNEKEHYVYFNGELLGQLPASSFPPFPLLVVKSNERMIEKVDTKSGKTEFDFVDPRFNNTQTKASTWEGDFANETNSVSVKRDLQYEINKADLEAISPDVITAYNEFGQGWGNGVQRDYIFFGMTQENNSNGRLNRFKRDMIYRLSITPNKLFTSMDDASTDPKKDLWTGKGDRPGFDGAVERMWANGFFEIDITFYQGLKNGGSDEVDRILLSVYAGDLMYLDSCHDRFQWNIFGNNWSYYSIKTENIKPKWYYPSDDGNIVYLRNEWDLSNRSQDLWYNAKELDRTSTYSDRTKKSFKFSLSAKVEAGPEVCKGSLGGTYENGNETEIVYTRTSGPDDLGTGDIEYIHSYIDKQISENKYTLSRETTYNLNFSLLPIDIRNVEEIREYMSKRKTRE